MNPPQDRILRLPGRYYRTIPMEQAGYQDEPLELLADRTALVVMHCWNVGCEDGPPLDMNYWIGVGFPQTTVEAARIMGDVIRPAVDATRAAGVAVAHVEASFIAQRHEQAMQDLDPPAKAGAAERSLPPVVPGWRQKMSDRFHGPDYMRLSPLANVDRARILEPLPGEIYVWQTDQFDRALRRRGIENLIYTGFCADMCVLRAPGGIEPMAPLGYRTFLMRDAVLGCEMPDSFAQRVATRWAIGYFESHYGDTLLRADFLKACGKLQSPGGGV
jgi:nicotinamidase-related amidase